MIRRFFFNGHVQNIIAIFIALVFILSAYVVDFSKIVHSSVCADFNGDRTACEGNACTWDIANCSALNSNYAGCIAQAGCSYPGNAGNCSVFSGAGSGTCTGVPGCSYPGNGGNCQIYNNNHDVCTSVGCTWPGNGGSCSAFSDHDTCSGTSGCSWNSGAGNSCGSFSDGQSCNGSPGCSANNGDCSTLSDGGGSGAMCYSQAGCSYDDPSGECSGYYFISCGGDNSTPDYCSGNYDNGLCDGTFDDGACTGSYDDATCVGSFYPGTCSGTISDVTPPTLVSATVNGTVLSLTYNEDLDQAGIPNAGTFTVLGISPASVGVSGRVVTLTLGENVGGGTTVTITYSPSIDPVIQDVAGNHAAGLSDVSVTNNTETTAPIISEVTPVTTPTNDPTPSYTFTTDEAGTITYGGSCTSSETNANTGTNTISFSTLSEDTYSDCTIIVTDPSHNVSNTINVSSFTIDTTTPGTPGVPDLQAGSDSGSSEGDNITSDNTPTFDITCDNGNTVNLKDGSTNLGSELCTGGAVTITSSELIDGVHANVRATQIDPAGNRSGDSFGIAVTIDTMAPSVSIQPALQGDGAMGNTNDTTPSFQVTCLLVGDSVQIYNGLSTEGSPATCIDGGIIGAYAILTAGTLSEGEYSIAFKETDVAGNVSDFSDALLVTVDITNPTISITSTSGGGAEVSGASVNVSADASDTNLVGVQFRYNTEAIGSEDTESPYSVSWDTTVLPDANYTLDAVARDLAGNYATSDGMNVAVNNIPEPPAPDPDTTSPVISNSVAIGSTTDTTPSYTFISDEAGDITYGGSCTSGTTSAILGSNTIIFNTLAVGTYSNCTIVVTDASLNPSNTLTVPEFTIEAPVSENNTDQNNNNVDNNSSGSSRSSSNNLGANNTPKNTLNLPACLPGETYNKNTGLPCSSKTPIVPGCSTGFLFSTLTGQSCSTKTSPVAPTNTTPKSPELSVTTKFKFTKDIPFGTERSEDVRQLQIFLNTHGFPISLTGVGSLGHETRYFGAATRNALIKFQKANNISPAIGTFGPKTRSFINSL